MWLPVWYHPQILDAMFCDMFSQHSFVNGERIGEVALANEAATAAIQGKMDLLSHLCGLTANFPYLLARKNQFQPWILSSGAITCVR